jgi:Ca2+-binding EF-hand superfamily protein
MGNCGRKKTPQKNATILTEDEIRLLLANTKLDRNGINNLHANFLQQCPTGRMTKKDFLKFFKEVHPAQSKREKADKFCDYVFNVIDRSKKGYVSFEDFVLCTSLTSHGDFREKCEFAFKLYDLDRDNKITKSEMTKVLTALYDLSGIQDRKGENAPAKKVDKIINQINSQRAPAPPGKKASKPPNFITRDQFIDACVNDNYIKNLFVEPIFVFGSNAPAVPSPAPQPKVIPLPAPVPDHHHPVIDIPSVYIDSKPEQVYVPPPPVKIEQEPVVSFNNYTTEERPLALFLDEKETFDFVDRYIAEYNAKKSSELVYDHTRAFPHDIDLSSPIVDYVHHQPYEVRYSDSYLSHPQQQHLVTSHLTADEKAILQDIKHLI